MARLACLAALLVDATAATVVHAVRHSNTVSDTNRVTSPHTDRHAFADLDGFPDANADALEVTDANADAVEIIVTDKVSNKDTDNVTNAIRFDWGVQFPNNLSDCHRFADCDFFAVANALDFEYVFWLSVQQQDPVADSLVDRHRQPIAVCDPGSNTHSDALPWLITFAVAVAGIHRVFDINAGRDCVGLADAVTNENAHNYRDSVAVAYLDTGGDTHPEAL